MNAARRRNLIISSTVLSVLGASVALLVLSTRRAQELARQQMEFVAAVSHELRTPLAVIRSAGENLADGVIKDDEQIRKYGDLVRNEGRRLTEMVEQILEFAGIESGQRAFALRPVALAPMLREHRRVFRGAVGQRALTSSTRSMRGCRRCLATNRRFAACLRIDCERHQVGELARWIGVRAKRAGRDVSVAIADRGIGIAASRTVANLRAVLSGARSDRGANPGRGPRTQSRPTDRRRLTVAASPCGASQATAANSPSLLPAATEEPSAVPRSTRRRRHGSQA